MSDPDLYEQIVRRTPDPIAAKDLKGRYRTANDRFVALLGGRRESILGATDEDLFDPADASAFRARDRAVVASEASETREERVAIDGREFVFETTRLPYYDDGEVAGTVTVRRDVTDRTDRERELRHKNERLDTFASVVSHDLRNPLDIAEGYVGKARQTGAEADFDEIETSIHRMKSLVDDLLTLARADRRIDDTEELDLASAAEGAWEGVDTGDATLELAETRALTADEGQFRRLLSNLYRNAVEHGRPDDRESVTVRVGATDGGFFVADDGVGIPQEKREQAFEPGYTTGEDGTGLGLAIVGRIAEAHGWDATLGESTEGGVRVEVRLDGRTDGDPDRQAGNGT